jgi:hypothetical protein
MRNVYKILVETGEGKRKLKIHTHRQQDIIKMDLRG